MKKYLIPYREDNHGGFDDEWAPHKGVTGWWYATGYFKDSKNPSQLYSYQFTLMRSKVYGVTPTILQLAFTDLTTGFHIFKQQFSFKSKKFYSKKNRVQFPPYGSLEKFENDFILEIDTKEFSINLTLELGKGAIWHGDNGLIKMGLIDDPKERTLYYSYTNMPSLGAIKFLDANGDYHAIDVVGKSWVDRQWGPFNSINMGTHWEWFSLRFFDDEEVMLFVYPQHNYYDGTYIDKSGATRLVRDYKYSHKEIIEADGFKFSRGWDIHMPGIKDESYTIKPIMEGQMNLAYFELLAEILDKNGKRVGFCFVELLPGVRSPEKFLGAKRLFKRL